MQLLSAVSHFCKLLDIDLSNRKMLFQFYF